MRNETDPYHYAHDIEQRVHKESSHSFARLSDRGQSGSDARTDIGAKRKCDGRTVPRVQCLRCNRRFSSQTDRVDRGLRRPDLVIPLFKLFVSKVTMRQMASLFCVNLKTIAHRKKLIGGQCLEVHQHVMTTTGVRLGLDAPYVFDELETFETSKIRQPLTMPVVLED